MVMRITALGCPHVTLELLVCPGSSASYAASPLMCPDRAAGEGSSPCPPARSRLISLLLTLAQPRLGCCRYLRSKWSSR